MKTGRYIRETFFVACCGAEKYGVGLVSGKRYRCKISSAVNIGIVMPQQMPNCAASSKT